MSEDGILWITIPLNLRVHASEPIVQGRGQRRDEGGHVSKEKVVESGGARRSREQESAILFAAPGGVGRAAYEE